MQAVAQKCFNNCGGIVFQPQVRHFFSLTKCFMADFQAQLDVVSKLSIVLGILVGWPLL